MPAHRTPGDRERGLRQPRRTSARTPTCAGDALSRGAPPFSALRLGRALPTAILSAFPTAGRWSGTPGRRRCDHRHSSRCGRDPRGDWVCLNGCRFGSSCGCHDSATAQPRRPPRPALRRRRRPPKSGVLAQATDFESPAGPGMAVARGRGTCDPKVPHGQADSSLVEASGSWLVMHHRRDQQSAEWTIVLRSIGARARDVRRIFATEGVALAVGGGCSASRSATCSRACWCGSSGRSSTFACRSSSHPGHPHRARSGTLALALLVLILPVRRAVRFRRGPTPSATPDRVSGGLSPQHVRGRATLAGLAGWPRADLWAGRPAPQDGGSVRTPGSRSGATGPWSRRNGG